MPHEKGNRYQAYVLGLYRLDNHPKGFLSPDQYAKRWGGTMSAQKIKDDLVRGKIPKRWCIRKPYGNKGLFKAMVHWDSTVNQYALSLAPELRPSGFDPKATFKPVNGPEWVPPMPHEVEDQEEESRRPQKMSIGKISTLDEADLQIKKLKILREQADLMLANNRTVLMGDVVSATKAWGVEIRGAWLSAKNRMKNMLPTCKTAQECDKILEEGFQDVWEKLGSPPDLRDGEDQTYGPN